MNKNLWQKYDRETLETIIKDSESYREVAQKLGYSLGGSYVQSIKQMIAHYNFNIDHFTGATGINKNRFKWENFQENSSVRSARLQPGLVYLRGHKCECCGLTEWLNQPITLEIHHIDGDRTNNTLENLQLLCL